MCKSTEMFLNLDLLPQQKPGVPEIISNIWRDYTNEEMKVSFLIG